MGDAAIGTPINEYRTVQSDSMLKRMFADVPNEYWYSCTYGTSSQAAAKFMCVLSHTLARGKVQIHSLNKIKSQAKVALPNLRAVRAGMAEANCGNREVRARRTTGVIGARSISTFRVPVGPCPCRFDSQDRRHMYTSQNKQYKRGLALACVHLFDPPTIPFHRFDSARSLSFNK